MRRVQPAPPRAAGYPKLKRAWRLLVGAAPLLFAPGAARGDASTPPCPQHGEKGSGKTPQAKGDIPAPKPPAVEDYPPMPGVIARPEPVRPPDPPPKPEPQKKAQPQKGKPLIPPKKQEPILGGLIGHRLAPPDGRAVAFTASGELDDGGFVIHPHGPDEPCRRRG